MSLMDRTAGRTPSRGVSDVLSTRDSGPPPSLEVIKRKVCLVGEQFVGKTSLIHRFVTGSFDESYIRTLGATVTKKAVDVCGPDGHLARVDMMILDIMGKQTFLQLFKDAYFSGAKGVLAVFDLTQKGSLLDLVRWVDGLRDTTGPIPVVALGNKLDLTDRIEVDDRAIEAVLGPLGIPVVKTSAKTGENVEEAFIGLARDIVEESR